MFDFRFVILGFGLANKLCSTYFAEFAKGNGFVFIGTALLALPISLLIGLLMKYVEKNGEHIKDFFDDLPEGSGIVLRNIIADSIILTMVTCSTVVLYLGSNAIFTDYSTLAIIGVISIVLAYLYQMVFLLKEKKSSVL